MELDAAIVAAEREALAAKRDLQKAVVRKDSFTSASEQRQQRSQNESLLGPYAQRSDEASTAGTPGARSTGSRMERVRPLNLFLNLAGAMLLLVVVVALIGRGRPPVLSPPPPEPQLLFVSDSLWGRPVGAEATPPPPG